MSKTSTISLHLNVQLNDLRQPNTSVGNLYSAVMNSNPVDFPIAYPADGVNNWIYWGAYAGGNDQGAVNPMASLTNGYTDIFESTVMANIDFEQKVGFSVGRGFALRLYSLIKTIIKPLPAVLKALTVIH